ncbi:MAG: DUF3108 domain-containing protein [Thiogranum sp.]
MFDRITLFLAAGLLAALGTTGNSLAAADAPYPEFIAYYDTSANGFGIGTVIISLKHEGDGRYLYRQESTSSGLASLFGSDDALETSRWQLVDGRIRPLEYRSQRKKGDDDDNEHLVFDWDAHKVRNTGAGKHWEIDLPPGTLDRLVMQLAMLFDLRDGATSFQYSVPRQGRIKDYRFALMGEEEIELTSGVYRTLKVGRTNDDKDQSWVWSAPELDYFPVRFLKKKSSGLKLRLELRKLDFAPFVETKTLEVAP